ncbi:hypothetical protein TRAPUB_3135 [Trametes pubescens]|uniref:Uncharacterized protein n=1 Tax=Trametes pubescens TaxID=154538 RepID=A0A1M2VEH5_TRAPU|nr:hypothetical protein TRAPUB_3135 [Trametes pubescens]
MERPPEWEWVSAQGTLIGSSGMLFVEQTAADIYFKNYWHAARVNLRLAVVCTSWGMSMLYIQRGRRHGPNQPWQWQPVQQINGAIIVQDHGLQPPNGQQMVPLAVRMVQAGSPGVHIVNDMLVGGLRLPWHRRVAVTRKNNKSMHYHQHKERRGHPEHVVPAIKDWRDGEHVTFYKLVYGSQVSSFRRAEL